MRRRQFLTRSGVVVGTVALAGCNNPIEPTEQPSSTPTDSSTATETAEGSPRPYAERFEHIVNMVKAGADPTGGESITPILQSRARDDTLFVFPEGTYLMDETWELRSFSNIGVIGEGATVTIPENFKNYLFALGAPGRARDVLFENMHFDCTADNSGARVLEARVDDGLEVRDVTVEGVQQTDFAATRFDVTSESGTGLVERLSLPDGGAPHSRAVGCYVGDQSVGQLSFVDCRMEKFPNNGLYGSSSQGPLSVRGGYYANNGVSSVRVGNGGEVIGVHVRCDRSASGYENMRGIRLRNGESALVEDCLVEMLDVTYADGAIVMEAWLSSATIRNTEVRIDTDGIPAIRAKTPARSEILPSGSTPSLVCENVRITGRASDHSTITVDSRDRCLFDQLDIRQSGDRRNGIHLEQSTDNRLSNSRISVTGRPLILEQATIDTANSVTAIGTPTPNGTAADLFGSDGAE